MTAAAGTPEPLQGEELRHTPSTSTDASRPAGHQPPACAGITPAVWLAVFIASGLAWTAILLAVLAVVWSA